jgi:hypothetical protein
VEPSATVSKGVAEAFEDEKTLLAEGSSVAVTNVGAFKGVPR